MKQTLLIIWLALTACAASADSVSYVDARLENANGNALGVDTVTRALNTIDYAHHEIHDASHYALKGWVDITSSATNTFLIVVPDTAKNPHVLYTFNAEAEMTLTVYENPTVSATGAVMTAYNNDRNSTNTPGVTFWSTPVYTGGTNIWAAKVGSGKKIGGGVRGDSEYILRRNAKYTFNVLNNSEQTKWFDYEFLWYEHTSKTD